MPHPDFIHKSLEEKVRGFIRRKRHAHRPHHGQTPRARAVQR
jgi:hypothetical protein